VCVETCYMCVSVFVCVRVSIYLHACLCDVCVCTIGVLVWHLF
jgi:hypothetical protein